MRRYLVICLTLVIPLSLTMLLTLAIPWSGWRARNDVVMAGETESSRSPAEIGPTLPLTPVGFLNICDRDPNVCPVDQVTWQGEPNGWQSTYKRWQRHTGTAAGSEVIWYGSAPYSGSNPNYANYREIRYMDFTYTPDGYPSVPGNPPITYEWQPWEPITNNYILHQYAGASESLAPLIGATACGTGVYYPLVDETSSFSYTPMSVTRNGECLGGGYIVAHLVELWGGPLSLTRMDKCDDVDLGIPASQSPRGNLVCKISPYAGTVYQGYVWGAGSTPSTPAVAGCEAVIYAWGWANPSQVTSGQDYAARFRNGELRFSKWINLSGQLSGTLPTPNDYAWWNSRCALAWRDVPNLLYSGVYKIGTSIYTDTIGAFSSSIVLPTSGGAFTSTFDGTEYFFPPDIFTETVRITHTMLAASEVSSARLHCLESTGSTGQKLPMSCRGKPPSPSLERHIR